MDLLADHTQDAILDVESPLGNISDCVRNEFDSCQVLPIREEQHLLDVLKPSKSCQPPWV